METLHWDRSPPANGLLSPLARNCRGNEVTYRVSIFFRYQQMDHGKPSMGHCEVRRFAWLPALLRQALLSNHKAVDVNTNNIGASSDRRSSPAEDIHNPSMAHYYGGYGPGPASPSSCATGSDTLEINTNVGRVTDELTDKSGVQRTEIDDAEKGQATMETATTQDIKYARGTSTLRNAAYAGEVMDITETAEKNTPNATQTRLPTSFRDMPDGDLSATQVYNDHACSRDVGANMGGLAQDTTAKVRVFPESVKADNIETLRFTETGVSPRVKDTCGAFALHYATDTHRSDGLRPEFTYGRMGYNRLPEEARPRARFVPRPNTPQTAVRSAAPRHDNDNQQPNTTDMTENYVTAVRSPAPRPLHTIVKPNGTTSRRPRPLCSIGLMANIILLLLHIGDGEVEPCSPPANNTNLTTCKNTMTHHGLVNGGAERCSPPTTPTITTVRSPAPRPCHYPDRTVNVMYDSAKEPHQQLGIHPVLNVTPLSLHIPQRSQTRNCRNKAFSHRPTPPSQSHLARHCRSVIVSGAGPPVCLPATGLVMGIKHTLHHLTSHLPPPHHQRLFYQGQPLGDDDPTPTPTAHGPIHLTL